MFKNVLSIVGFSLFILGVVSLVLMLVRANFYFLDFIDSFGGTIGLVIRLLMIFGGIIIVFFARTDWEKENADLSE